MVKVKINNKTYQVKELDFKDYTKIEEQGFSILDAFRKKQLTLIAMGFVCAVVGCDREDAERLLTQHVLGGGNIIDITNAFGKAVAESDFFQKMLGVSESEETSEQTEEQMNEEAPEEEKQSS